MSGRRNCLSHVLMILLLSAIISVAINIPLVKGSGTIYIRADGSVEGTIYIVTSDKVTYVFTSDINDSIVVERSNIIVDGKGHALQGPGNGNGFSLSDVSNITIQNVKITYFYNGAGIYLSAASNNSITTDNITNNGRGIWLQDSSDYNSITASNITNNKVLTQNDTFIGAGVYLFDVSNNMIVANNIIDNGRGIQLQGASNSISANNITTNTYEGIIFDGSSNNISANRIANNHDGVDLYGSSNYNNIAENIITNNAYFGIIFYDSSNYNSISGNTITENKNGGALLNFPSNYNNITANNITANTGYGILLSGSSNNTIVANSITDNTVFGVEVRSSSNNSITANDVTKNIYGIDLLDSSNCIVAANNILNNGHGVQFDDSSNIIAANSIIANNEAGITSSSPCSNNSIIMNNITANNGHGIELYGSSNNITANSIKRNSEDGIHLIGSLNYITANLIENNDRGIQLSYDSLNNSIIANMITGNSKDGILLVDSSNSIIAVNMVTNNQYCGIGLNSSSNNIVVENQITNNANGILFSSYCSDNIVAANNITDNEDGILFSYYSSENIVYFNNFIDNAKQVVPYSAYSVVHTDVWDIGYPMGGNYWSDYKGIDANTDRIGDMPYVIDANNQDRYPRMNLWIVYEHELTASVSTLDRLWLGKSLSIDIIVRNEGLSDEDNVQFLLFINGTMVKSDTIPLLESIDSYMTSYPWTPAIEGVYNITTYVKPVLGETSLQNNKMTKTVTVKVPQIGIKTGDWINFTFTVPDWSAGTPYPSWFNEWYRIEFSNVTGTNANTRLTQHWYNGTEQTETFLVDIASGDYDFVIPANLTMGDIIYIKSYGDIPIIGETTRNYVGVNRTVIYANFSQDGHQYDYYWDKLTGVLVEVSVVFRNTTTAAKAVETNLWQITPPVIPEFTSSAIILPLMITILLFVAIIKKKQKIGFGK